MSHKLWLIISHFSIYVCIISMKEIKTNRREFKKSIQHDSMSTEYVHQSEYQTLTVPVWAGFIKFLLFEALESHSISKMKPK